MAVEFKVIVGWDREAQKYFIVESDVEGLWLEKPTFEALIAAMRDVALDLIEHNHGRQKTTPVLRVFREIEAPVPVGLGA
jgi:hypothetical protein